jgi:hypothetical protein
VSLLAVKEFGEISDDISDIEAACMYLMPWHISWESRLQDVRQLFGLP